MKFIHTVFLLLFNLLSFCIIETVFSDEPVSYIVDIEPSNKKTALGEKLFYDKRLSGDNSISCNSCHNLKKGGADDTPFSRGVNNTITPTNTPTVYNAVFNFTQFWNGKAKTLYEQVNCSLTSPYEMASTPSDIEAKLNLQADYKKLFKNIYNDNFIKHEYVIDALVHFEKSLITKDSRFDKYLKGGIQLSSNEQNGYILFKELGCITCHNGINLGGNSFQKIGSIKPYIINKNVRSRYYITGRDADINMFKVPTLRNIILTKPYLHDGSIFSFEEIIKIMSIYNLGFALTDKEIESLKSFMITLTGKKPDIVKKR